MATVYRILSIDPPVSQADLTAYKTLRLTALQTDPAAFSSTYAREAAFPEDVWRQRLDSPLKQVLIASDSEGGWIGTAWIIGPSGMPPAALAPFEEAGLGAKWTTYGLFGMWVHPAHRGKGVGKRLVDACLDWARTNIDTKLSTGLERVAVLLVRNDNVAARVLYSRAGFTELGEVSSSEGETWMMAKI